jgi:hypothetical protein
LKQAHSASPGTAISGKLLTKMGAGPIAANIARLIAAMSAFGTKRKSRHGQSMSAFGSKADMNQTSLNVRV